MEWHPFFYKGHETNIEVNKLGEVRRVSKDWMKYNTKTGLVKFSISKDYYQTSIKVKNIGQVNLQVHQIIAIAFLNHVPNKFEKVVDHIDGNKKNNNIENLQIITQRENTIKRLKKSKYPTGVHRKTVKYKNKVYEYFNFQILLKNKRYQIGNFKKPEDASAAYQEALRKINAGEFATN